MFTVMAGLIAIGSIASLAAMVAWPIVVIVLLVWAIGAAATSGAIAELGWNDPYTIGDSFTGDDDLDGVFVMLWPIAWLIWIGARVGALAAKR